MYVACILLTLYFHLRLHFRVLPIDVTCALDRGVGKVSDLSIIKTVLAPRDHLVHHLTYQAWTRQKL